MLELNYENRDKAERNEQAVKLADEISRFLNGGCHIDVADLAQMMMKDHPTLLQRKMLLCVQFIELMSQREGDLRTKASEKLAHKIIESTDEADRVMPLI